MQLLYIGFQFRCSLDECSYINYERRKDVLGVDIETIEGDAFLKPIAYKTHSHKKSPFTGVSCKLHVL